MDPKAIETPNAPATGEPAVAPQAESQAADETLLTAEAAVTKDGSARDVDKDGEAEGEDGAEGKEATDEEAEELTPESYGDFDLPQGFEPVPEVLGEFKAFAAEHKLDKAEAQKLVDLQVKLKQMEMQKAMATVQKWAKDAEADPEIGGVDFMKNAGLARSAMESFATPKFKVLLDQTGLGNHPEMIRAFTRIGKAMSEDGRVVTGSGAGAGPREMSEREYMATVFNKGKKE